jgi:hypothetical protein
MTRAPVHRSETEFPQRRDDVMTAQSGQDRKTAVEATAVEVMQPSYAGPVGEMPPHWMNALDQLAWVDATTRSPEMAVCSLQWQGHARLAAADGFRARGSGYV